MRACHRTLLTRHGSEAAPSHSADDFIGEHGTNAMKALETHAAFLFTLIARQPDLTLDEIVAAIHKRRIAGSRSAVWRFFQRHKISFKKSLRAAEQERTDVARAPRRWMRQQGMFNPARLVFLDETAASTNMVRLRGRCPRGERLIDHVPHGHWKTITFVAGLRRRAMVAPLVLDGPMNAAIFVTYLKECLVPKLKRGDVVMMDSLPVHRVAGYARSLKQPERNYVIFPNIPRISTRSSKPSANSRRIYEKRPSELFRASRAKSQRLWPHSAGKNAPITSDMQDMRLRDRNPL